MNQSEQQKVSQQATRQRDRFKMFRTLRALPRDVTLLCVGLLLIVLTSSGCCTKPVQQPCAPLPPVLMPALSEPLPSVDYSITAAKTIKTWANALTATSATSGH